MIDPNDSRFVATVGRDAAAALDFAHFAKDSNGNPLQVVHRDVTPHNMGVKVAGDRMSVVIQSNTSIPTRAKKVFATTEDNQDFVAIEIYQGEHELASKNRRLGRFVLGDLASAPRGRTKVEVSFTMDADGSVRCVVARGIIQHLERRLTERGVIAARHQKRVLTGRVLLQPS